MKSINKMKMTIPAVSANEGLARLCVSAFASQLDPRIDEIADIRTAVSEAVTNCIIHAYKGRGGLIYIESLLYPDRITVKIKDKGCGIDDIDKAMEPLFTTGGDDRSGLGFSVMQSFMDSVKVKSGPSEGTTVSMTKILRRADEGNPDER
ncbi:MAG: anti-sigma F factor [Clostridia bacterium]|nr:anti-sigma F factor [Clostridia bacterium]